MRRDDHIKFEIAHNMSLIQPDYYINAVKKLKNKLGSKAVFLLITDDIPWCQENLLPKSKDLILVSDPSRPEKEGIGHDLAIMTLCQYSIISRGTFSIWASFFAKGNSIAPYLPKYQSMFSQHNWTKYIHTSAISIQTPNKSYNKAKYFLNVSTKKLEWLVFQVLTKSRLFFEKKYVAK